MEIHHVIRGSFILILLRCLYVGMWQLYPQLRRQLKLVNGFRPARVAIRGAMFSGAVMIGAGLLYHVFLFNTPIFLGWISFAHTVGCLGIVEFGKMVFEFRLKGEAIDESDT